jgi:hypothetical protein
MNAVLGMSKATASILNTEFVIESSQLLTDGRFQLKLNGGVIGNSYVLMAFSNLSDWTPISTFVNTNPPVIIYDPNTAGFPQRFYQIVSP